MSGARFVRFFPSDWRSGCIGLTPEEEGVYIRVCAHGWETGVRLSSDDAVAAARLMLDVRMWRRIKIKLVTKGKLHVCEDGIYSPRAEREFIAATTAAGKQVQASSDVGTGGDGHDCQYADGRASAEGREPARPGLLAEVAEKSPRSLREVSEKVPKKTAKINGPLKSQEPRANNHREDTLIVRPESDAARANGPDEISGLNGSTAEIVSGVARFLNALAPDYDTARRIIASNVGIYGDRAVRDGYAELMADVADNRVRVPSVKALVGYFKTASDRGSRPSKQRPSADFAAQRIERGREFMAILNEERVA